MRNNIFIEHTEVSGIIFILLKKLIPINLNEYIKKMNDDTIDFSSESSFDFFTYNLKKYDENMVYPSVYREDILKPDFIIQYKKTVVLMMCTCVITRAPPDFPLFLLAIARRIL